jgi:hypothetical protein
MPFTVKTAMKRSGDILHWITTFGYRTVGRTLWFFVFNTATILYLILSGALKFNFQSVVSYLIAALLINGIILYSAKRNHPDWK